MYRHATLHCPCTPYHLCIRGFPSTSILSHQNNLFLHPLLYTPISITNQITNYFHLSLFIQHSDTGKLQLTTKTFFVVIGMVQAEDNLRRFSSTDRIFQSLQKLQRRSFTPSTNVTTNESFYQSKKWHRRTSSIQFQSRLVRTFSMRKKESYKNNTFVASSETPTEHSHSTPTTFDISDSDNTHLHKNTNYFSSTSRRNTISTGNTSQETKKEQKEEEEGEEEVPCLFIGVSRRKSGIKKNCVTNLKLESDLLIAENEQLKQRISILEMTQVEKQSLENKVADLEWALDVLRDDADRAREDALTALSHVWQK